MGADRNWISVELAEGADPDAVREAMDYEESRMDYEARHGDALVFDGIEYQVDRIENALSSVIEHVSAVALFHKYDGAGAGHAAYYEPRDGSLEELERLGGEGVANIRSPYFDYLSAKYDVHAPV